MLPARALRPEDMLMPGVPKSVKVVNLKRPAEGDSNTQKIELEEWVRLEKELEGERGKRLRMEASLEAAMQESAERSRDVTTLKKRLFRAKISFAALFIVILAVLALGVAALSARLDLERELVEARSYKIMYDSAGIHLNKVSRERDSIRRELAALQEKYNDALAENEELAAHAAGPGRRGGVRDRKLANINIEMVSVPGGSFNMGCTGEQGADCGDNEKPARAVAVGGFSIGRYPVTQSLWQQVMGSNPSHYKGANLPVERVSWRDAQEFIKKLNLMTGKSYRLPTEAEWEYAARGGARSRAFKFSGSNHLEEVAWFARTTGTTGVGSRKPNELGIYDMSGNVSEWVSDRYGTYGGEPSGDDRVLRGGSWSSVAKSCRVSNRGSMPPGARSNNIGFRLAH